MMKDRGDPIDRVDARAKVTGAAKYAAEVPVARAAHAVLITSTIARGRVTAMDTARAEKAAGVLAVITPRNAPRLPPQPDLAHKASIGDRVLQLLQNDEVSYSGQPIGMVVADTLDRARHAAALVTVRYEAQTANVAMTRDLPGEEPTPPPPDPQAKQQARPNPADHRRGDVEAGLAHVATKIDATYTIPYETHSPMEPHATVAVWHGAVHLTVYDSTQGIFEVQRKLAQVFGIPKANIRVISHFVGGGFGCKGGVWSHVPLAAMAALKVGRPVKLVVARPQMFGPVGFRPATEQHVVLGATREGVLTAIRHDSRSATCRFDEFVEHTTAATRQLYRCPNVATSERLVRLDIGTPHFMRAPGESTGSFALECALDELAAALKVDPVELRLRNYAEADPETGRPWSSKSLKECYRAAAERFGWAKRNPQPGAMREGQLLVGWGMASATYPAHQRPASASASLRPDGTALVRAGSQDIGTGTYTVMTQVAADALGLPVERVRFELGDTDLPQAPTSAGSSTCASVGPAVRAACLAVRNKLADLAQRGATADDVVIERDRVAVRGAPGAAGRGEPLAALFGRARVKTLDASYQPPGPGQMSEADKPHASRSFGAQFAEVHVDPQLGRVRVARMVSAFAAGRILNAKTARSQYLGGIVWGIGMALMEQTVYDARLGRVMNADLAEYHVPVNLDVPDIDVIFVDERDEQVNDIGVKGIGEIGICGAAAAIANAVYHATGRRIRDLPITVDKLLL
jgi:xanthine dehydrogenase YagR molybdenum-binding subunit